MRRYGGVIGTRGACIMPAILTEADGAFFRRPREHGGTARVLFKKAATPVTALLRKPRSETAGAAVKATRGAQPRAAEAYAPPATTSRTAAATDDACGEAKDEHSPLVTVVN